MDEYELLEMTAEEFKPFFAEHHPRIFGNGFSCMPDDYLSEDEKGAQKKHALHRDFDLNRGVLTDIVLELIIVV